jgi:hypothetical protein
MPVVTQFLNFSGNARKIIIPIVSLAALFVFLQLALPKLSPTQPALKPAHIQPLTEIPATAQKVETGFYPVNLYELDVASNTYYVDAYIWFKWKGDFDPIANLEFPNAVEEWGMNIQQAYEKPQIQPDGTLYQIIRVEGRFFQPFTLTKYPLDEQRLGIVMENSIYTYNDLVYVADTTDSGFADTLAIPGWNINKWEIESLLHQYPTRFGERSNVQVNLPYSYLRYQLLISRPINYFIWKLLLPLIIVVVSSWCALLLHPSYVDARVSMSSTALLTTVFLQQAYSDTLPSVGYLVLLDKIYALSYISIVAAIIETIVTAGWANSGKQEDYERVVRLDRPFLLVQLTVLIVGILLLIYL